MDIKKIQDLVKIVTKSNIGEIRIEEKDFKITIKQKQENLQPIAAPQPHLQQFIHPFAGRSRAFAFFHLNGRTRDDNN